MINRTIQLTLIVLLLWPISAISATSFTQIVIFGDSLSDTGNLFRATNNAFPASPPYFQGRVSNGPIWVDSLEQQLNLPVINFAIAGATTGFDNVNDDLAPGLNLDGMGDQLNTYLDQQAVDSGALYIVWGGSNNFLQLPADPVAAVGTSVTELVTLVATLSTLGAKHILVVNLPDLGLTPRLVGTPVQADASALTVAFNQALVAELSKLSIDITEADVFTVLNQVAAAPNNFGLSVVDKKCLDFITLLPCNNPDQYFFWDDIHPTTVGHSIIADQIISAIETIVNSDSQPSVATRSIPVLTPIGHIILVLSIFGLVIWMRCKPRNSKTFRYL